MKLEPIELETCDILNIREAYEDLDLLGASLLKAQQSPIIVGPLAGGKRPVFDGSRRVRAALLKGMKTLSGIVSDRNLTPDELAQFQLISDFHKKHLTPYERSNAVIGIKKANPALTIKQLAALLDIEESLYWKYAQAEKLSPESLAAFKEGRIGLTVVVELAKLPHDKQADELGKSREDVRKSRKKSATPAVRTAKIKCPLPGGQVVTVAGEAVSLEEAIEAAGEAMKLMKAALAKGLNAKTAERVWKDVVAASA